MLLSSSVNCFLARSRFYSIRNVDGCAFLLFATCYLRRFLIRSLFPSLITGNLLNVLLSVLAKLTNETLVFGWMMLFLVIVIVVFAFANRSFVHGIPCLYIVCSPYCTCALKVCTKFLFSRISFFCSLSVQNRLVVFVDQSIH